MVIASSALLLCFAKALLLTVDPRTNAFHRGGNEYFPSLRGTIKILNDSPSSGPEEKKLLLLFEELADTRDGITHRVAPGGHRTPSRPQVPRPVRRCYAIRGERPPRGRALEAAELRQLFEACADGRVLGARDAAVLALLYGAGLRRAEAVALDLGDLNPDSGQLRVLGKGDKQRMAYLPAGGRAALAEWLRRRGDAAGPLLQPVNRGGEISPRRMSAQSLRLVCRRRAQAAGILDFSPHDLRRSFVGAALDAGADISAIQRLVGHARVQTTTRYDRRPERANRRAAELVDVPFEQSRRPSAS